MGLLEKLIPKSLRPKFENKSSALSPTQGYRTFTEYSPYFSSFDGTIYEQAQTRAIVERIAVACSKLKPEFVTPDDSNGSIPRVQRLFSSWPNELMTWPEMLRRLASQLFVETTAFVVPGYDERDGSINALYPMKPSYTEVVEYEDEPWIRFHLLTGDVQAFPFYDVAILTRFQLDSDIFGGGNMPLTPTMRLMDAQRQAEEIALKTGADIRFVGKVVTNMHDDDIKKFRDKFSQSNFGAENKSALVLYDNRIDSLQQIDQDHYTIEPEEMERIDKALYQYFGINEKILQNSYNEQEWSAFYEGVIEPFALMLGTKLTKMLLTPTQVRKGNHIMFSSSYLEYATTDSKIKVARFMAETGSGRRNEIRDIFQLPHTKGGDVFTLRGEFYMVDEENNVVAESGGHSQHDTSWSDDDHGWSDNDTNDGDTDDGGTE